MGRISRDKKTFLDHFFIGKIDYGIGICCDDELVFIDAWYLLLDIGIDTRSIIGEHTGAEKVAPDFTPKERINIEIYAERLTDLKEREHYLRLSRGELLPERSSRDPIERAPSSDPDKSLSRAAHQFLSQGAGRGR